VFEIAGKLTLTDSVLAAAGTKVQEVAGDCQTDEAEHGITIKSTGNSLANDNNVELFFIQLISFFIRVNSNILSCYE